MVNDPIGDMLIQIKNAVLARNRTVALPYSRLKHAVATVLADEGYVGGVEKTGAEPKTLLKMSIVYNGDAPVFTDCKRKSKPGLRVYVPKNAIPRVIGGMGMAILSTPQGVMTGKEAIKRGIGGELLCEVW